MMMTMTINNADAELVAKIKVIHEFQVQVSTLASCLHLSEPDAEQALLLELLDHRCLEWSYERINNAIAERDHYFLSLVYWSQREVTHQYYQQQQREAETAAELQMLGIEGGSNKQQQLPSPSSISAAFSSPTADWVNSVLAYGQRETQSKFHQTDKQFNQKLRRTIKFIHNHPDKFSKIRQEHKQLMEEK
ncbi:hypothetical protein [Schleiferilactobacillus harbinensis]|uniref:hypothetical protein n=1 Tax=Schleiferilactobacillus harbinensis TaxID=304207 RepID=UPI0039E9D694